MKRRTLGLCMFPGLIGISLLFITFFTPEWIMNDARYRAPCVVAMIIISAIFAYNVALVVAGVKKGD